MPFDRANRTYYVSDERLRAFRALTLVTDIVSTIGAVKRFVIFVPAVNSAHLVLVKTVTPRVLMKKSNCAL